MKLRVCCQGQSRGAGHLLIGQSLGFQNRNPTSGRRLGFHGFEAASQDPGSGGPSSAFGVPPFRGLWTRSSSTA